MGTFCLQLILLKGEDEYSEPLFNHLRYCIANINTILQLIMTFDRELVGCIEHLPHLVSFQSTLGGSVGLCTKNTLYRFICCFPYNINNFPSSERITPFPSDQLRIHLTNSGNNIDLNDFNNHQSTNEQICTFVVSFLTPRPPPLLLVTSFLAPRDDVGFLVTLLETGRATGAGARGGAGAETRTAAGC